MSNYNKWYQQILYISYSAVDALSRMIIPDNGAIVFDIDDTLIHSSGKSITPIVNLFNYVKDSGLFPIIITNRSGDPLTIEYTQKQLVECGIFGYKLLYFRPPDKDDMPYRYKEKARQSIHERGMIVIMSIGDKPWDIGNYGGVGFILPNY
jgi:hypothetical protein